MTVASLLAVIAGLLPLLVAVFEAIQGHQARERKFDDALTRHSLDELHTGTDRVRQPPTV